MADLFIRKKVDTELLTSRPDLKDREYTFDNGNNDLQLGPNGDLVTIEGTEKLKQDLSKMLLTVRGSNIVFTTYGSELYTFIGQKSNFEYWQAQIRDAVIDGVALVQYLNKDNPNLDEQIQTFDFIEILQSEDTVSFEVRIQVTTKGNKQVGAQIRFEG